MEENNNQNLDEQAQALPQENVTEEHVSDYQEPQDNELVFDMDYAPVFFDIPILTPEERAAERRKKRRKKIIIWVAIAVFVFTGAVSGFVFVNKYFDDYFVAQPDRPSNSQSRPAVSIQGPGVENGPTVQLQDRPDENTPIMSIPEIYQQVSSSVVMILAGTDASMSLGTGIVMSEDGYIITNAHIISDSDDIQIVLSDNKTIYHAKIMGSDAPSDIAVLKIDAHNLTPAVFGDSDQVVIGEGVVTIGNPYSISYAQTVTDGIISGIRRNVHGGTTNTNLLQTNAQLNPGNSGGPLINMYGQVIGINSSKIMSSGTATYEGMGFAIPMTDAKAIVDELIRYGYVSPDPVIGVTVSYVSPDTAVADAMVPGCMIMSIEEDSDAYKQGLRIGDIITAINGKSFEDLDGFIAEKNRYRIGDTVLLTYWRQGEIYMAYVKLMNS